MGKEVKRIANEVMHLSSKDVSDCGGRTMSCEFSRHGRSQTKWADGRDRSLVSRQTSIKVFAEYVRPNGMVGVQNRNSGGSECEKEKEKKS